MCVGPCGHLPVPHPGMGHRSTFALGFPVHGVMRVLNVLQSWDCFHREANGKYSNHVTMKYSL